MLEVAATLTTDPGEHDVAISVRPCSGNCGRLDPVFDTCGGTYSLPHGTTKAVVHLRATEGCTFELLD